MYMIEIDEDKFSYLEEDIEKGLRYIGKAMQCLDELKNSEKHNRERYGYRDNEDRMRGREMDYMRDSESRYSRY